MGKKYFTISYDDGLEQDRKIIGLMKEYGIAGTFNISSGLFGKKGYIKRMFGDMGFDAPEDVKKSPKTVDHFILPLEEAKELYASYDRIEIASHGTHHMHQDKLDEPGLKVEIADDIAALSDIFGTEIKGHIFPYGGYNDAVIKTMKDAGAVYGRKAMMMVKPKDFALHIENGIITPTCWHLDKFTEDLLKHFIASESDEDQYFYMWGHGYELDYGTKRGNWNYLESLFKTISEAKDVECVTNMEMVDIYTQKHEQ